VKLGHASESGLWNT